MSKNYFLVFVISLLSFSAYNQETAKNNLSLRIAPLSILDPLRTTIQPGFEFIFKNRISFGFDYGFQFDKIFYQNESYMNNRKYFKLRTEVKYFVYPNQTQKGNLSLPYVGFEFLYVPDKYTIYDSWYGIGEYTINYKSAEIDKYALGFILKVGYEMMFYNNFLVDFNIAAGYKYRVHNIIANDFAIEKYTYFEEWYASPDNHPGVYKMPFFTFSCKIGYVLFKF